MADRTPPYTVTTDEDAEEFGGEDWTFAVVVEGGRPWLVAADLQGDLWALTYPWEDEPTTGRQGRAVRLEEFDLPFEVVWTDARPAVSRG